MAVNNSTTMDPFVWLNGTSSAKGASAGGFSEADLLQIYTFVAALKLYDVTTYLLWGIGIPSNIFSCLTSSKIRPVSSSTVFITILAMVDLLYIVWDGLFWLLIPTLKVWMPSEACRLYLFTGSVLMHYSVWLMVAITGERFIAVWLPLKVSNICTTRRAAGVSLIMLVCIAAMNIPYTYIPHSYLTPIGAWFCRYEPSYADFISKWTFVDHSVYILVPWPILTFCNAMIICGLRLSSKRKQRLTNQIDETKNPNLSITIMLVSASVISLILLTPNMVFFLHVRSSQWNYEATAEEYATYTFLSAFFFFLSSMNHAINFWVYVVSGRRFRQRFFDLIRCRGKGAKKYIQPSTTLSKLSSVAMQADEKVVKVEEKPPMANGKDEKCHQ
ncbi:FMRFamide peptide receptor frpr-18-like [Liolophura sinensis]|uniref:FMRFamide peptide receptor frpr-18-like n=1 Tax=Liolophura sinensis TaxID=3198878 RepID=UPI0031588800